MIVCSGCDGRGRRRPVMSQALRARLAAKLAAKRTEPSNAIALPPYESDRLLADAYDALDAYKNARALRCLDGVLKTHPRFQLARALRSLALARDDIVAHEDEVREILRGIRAEGFVDENVLRIALMTLREFDEKEEIEETLEEHLRANPTSTSAMMSLFTEYAQDFRFDDQQRIAMKMYKVSGETKHLLWAVSSMLGRRSALVDARRAFTVATSSRKETEAPAMDENALLKLANGMLGKVHAKGDMQDLDSFALYMYTLTELGENLKAYEVACSDLADSCVPMPIERERSRAHLAILAGKKEEAKRHHENVLEMVPDDWVSMNAVLDLCCDDASFENLCAEMAKLDVRSRMSSESLARFPTMHTCRKGMNVEDAKNFVDRVCAKVEELGGEREVGRGSHILRVELAFRLMECGHRSSTSLAEAILAYHERFGTWNSCAKDMQRYTSALNAKGHEDGRLSLIEKLSSTALELTLEPTEDEESKKKAISTLRAKTSALNMLVDLNAFCPSWYTPCTETSGDDGLVIARKLMKAYDEHLPLFTGVDEREQTPLDVLPYVAACALMGVGVSRKESNEDADSVNALMSAAAALSIGLKKSPRNAVLLFSLASVYTLLGAVDMSLKVLTSLDIKHVQMSTLLHHMLPACNGGAKMADCRKIYAHLEMFERERQDIGSSVVTAFMNGKYTKVLEFATFRRKLDSAFSLMCGAASNSWIMIPVLSGEHFGCFDESRVVSSATYAFSSSNRGAELPSADASRWDENGDEHGAFTHVDDFKTNPPWLGPTCGDPGLISVEWWENKLSRSGFDERFSWYFPGARFNLRRRWLLLCALRDGANKRDLSEHAKLLSQLRDAAKNVSETHTCDKLTRDLDFTLLSMLVDPENKAMSDDALRALGALCDLSCDALSASSVGIFARGAAPASFVARTYCCYVKLVATIVNDPDLVEKCEELRLKINAACESAARADDAAIAQKVSEWYGDDSAGMKTSIIDVSTSASESIKASLVLVKGK